MNAKKSGINIQTTLPEYMETFYKKDDVPEEYKNARYPGKYFTVQDGKLVNYNLGAFRYGDHFTKVFTDKFADKFVWA